ncbi:hypothetical protein FNV43_RR01749 [Rhamnella rubrinervis]|uniref:Fanconi-associated nuclease n=1 Tax=Rhamnella rubrinervis TaxID=2594499 RepID=A0A8K0HQE5_9ROSA|nr:hypothetical protein FNV43_RR01749 [Rhamnella rubrinervis]
MLRGRESLIRLVGKRRRLLPHRHSLLSFPISLNLRADEDGEVSNTKMEHLEDEGVHEGEESVEMSCPICGCKLSGNNNTINSHIDVCLIRGTKRKLTQRTLLEMNFSSKAKVQIHSSEREELENHFFNNFVQNSIHGLCDVGAIEETKSNLCGSLLNLKCEMRSEIDGPSNNTVGVDRTDINVDTHPLFLKDEVPDYDMAMPMDGISGMVLETFIVGRRFSNEKELNHGESIFLVRDPLNAKDPNAIEVISADSGSSKVLGFLPRELSQYLSPLIDKYCLSFEGRITSVPKCSLDVVPIQISCHKVVSNCSREIDDIEIFKYLWKNVWQVIESSKNCRASATKYQQNFCVFVQEVLRSNPHLFTDDEKKFMESFNSLSDDCQRLFVRLYTRKGPWFRMSSISYPEILDPLRAMKELSAAGFTRSFNDKNELHCEDINGILNLLNVAELREIMCILKQNYSSATRKRDLIASLVSLFEDGFRTLLPSMILDRTCGCIAISSKAESLFWRTERLFFLNGEQDLSAFLLVDLGIVKYPTYKSIITELIFSGRDDLLAYEEAIEVAQMIDEALDGNNNELVLRCIKIAQSHISSMHTKVNESSIYESVVTFRSCFSASWVYSKVILLGVSFLERERRGTVSPLLVCPMVSSAAVHWICTCRNLELSGTSNTISMYSSAIYLLKQLLECFTCDGRRGYWMLRLSVDLEHIGYHDESLSIAESGLLDPWVRAGSRMALQRRVLRLGKPPRRWKIPDFAKSIKRKINEVHVRGRPLNSEMGMKSRFYGEDGEQCGVEQLALQYYAGEGGGWKGVHTESGIWLTIFGLLMWDIMFSDVPNVFRTRFQQNVACASVVVTQFILQTAPLDLETDSFYLVRKDKIEYHLRKIHDGMAEEILITSWESHLGTACRGVNWDRHTLPDLRAAVGCIGGPCLALLCQHLAQDYRSWSSGMPDLLLWRFHEEYNKAEAKLVEVKGPRDRLSEQQRAWLLLLMDCGFDTEVCKVSPEPTS